MSEGPAFAPENPQTSEMFDALGEYSDAGTKTTYVGAETASAAAETVNRGNVASLLADQGYRQVPGSNTFTTRPVSSEPQRDAAELGRDSGDTAELTDYQSFLVNLQQNDPQQANRLLGIRDEYGDDVFRAEVELLRGREPGSIGPVFTGRGDQTPVRGTAELGAGTDTAQPTEYQGFLLNLQQTDPQQASRLLEIRDEYGDDVFRAEVELLRGREPGSIGPVFTGNRETQETTVGGEVRPPQGASYADDYAAVDLSTLEFNSNVDAVLDSAVGGSRVHVGGAAPDVGELAGQQLTVSQAEGQSLGPTQTVTKLTPDLSSAEQHNLQLQQQIGAETVQDLREEQRELGHLGDHRAAADTEALERLKGLTADNYVDVLRSGPRYLYHNGERIDVHQQFPETADTPTGERLRRDQEGTGIGEDQAAKWAAAAQSGSLTIDEPRNPGYVVIDKPEFINAETTPWAEDKIAEVNRYRQEEFDRQVEEAASEGKFIALRDAPSSNWEDAKGRAHSVADWVVPGYGLYTSHKEAMKDGIITTGEGGERRGIAMELGLAAVDLAPIPVTAAGSVAGRVLKGTLRATGELGQGLVDVGGNVIRTSETDFRLNQLHSVLSNDPGALAEVRRLESEGWDPLSAQERIATDRGVLPTDYRPLPRQEPDRLGVGTVVASGITRPKPPPAAPPLRYGPGQPGRRTPKFTAQGDAGDFYLGDAGPSYTTGLQSKLGESAPGGPPPLGGDASPPPTVGGIAVAERTLAPAETSAPAASLSGRVLRDIETTTISAGPGAPGHRATPCPANGRRRLQSAVQSRRCPADRPGRGSGSQRSCTRPHVANILRPGDSCLGNFGRRLLCRHTDLTHRGC